MSSVAVTRRMPAEWESHSATWIAWPHQTEDWPGKFEPIPWVYAEIVRHLHQSEPVYVLAEAEVEKLAEEILTKCGVDLSRVTFVDVPTDRTWVRDYGPIFVHDKDNSITALDWRFNGWAKYDNCQRDDNVPSLLVERFGWSSCQPTMKGQRVVLEGGSIDVNGQGTLLTTEECLLSPVQSRNPNLSKSDYEQVFREQLGIETVIWLGRGIEGDDTHGHVDDLARFVGPATVVTVHETNKDDPNHEPLRENLERLQQVASLDVVTLPMPAPVVFEGQRLPASYANFYVANDRVLVPTFNDPNDRIVLGILADLFPDRKIAGIHSVDLVWGLGTLHCLTQQQPAVNKAASE